MKIRYFFFTTSIAMVLFFLVTSSVSGNRFIPKSDLIYQVLRVAESQYVDPSRLDPEKMLEGAMEQLSKNIAQVLTQYEKKDGVIRVSVRVDSFQKNFEYTTLNNLTNLNAALSEIVEFAKQHLDASEKAEEVDYAILNGLLGKLDPHTSLLPPKFYEEFSTSTQGNFGGVGMMIGLRDGNLTVIAPIDGTPASAAGLRAKDRVVQINEESTVNLGLSDAVNKLRGEPGTEVIIYIMREGLSEPKRISIIRDIIQINSVESYVFNQPNEKRIGYLQINSFQQNTLSELNSHLGKMDTNLSDFHGLILDLRNNPGGLLKQAIDVSDRFLSSGAIVYTSGLNFAKLREHRANWPNTLEDIPVIVLTNNGSASASEIVAAALKKNKRAVLLGTQTFGKGSVQQLYPMYDGSALKMTIAKYLTPGKVSIQSVGVTPDIELTPYLVSRDYLSVKALEDDQGESSLEGNFEEWQDERDQVKKQLFYLFDSTANDTIDPDENQKQRRERLLQVDSLVQSAKKILLKNEKQNYDSLVKNALDFAEKEEKLQEKKLEEKLATLDIDWRVKNLLKEGQIQAKAWIEVQEKIEQTETEEGKQSEAEEGKQSEAEEGNEEKEQVKVKEEGKWTRLTGNVPVDQKIRIYLEARNIGKEPISRLMAVSESKNFIFNQRQFAFGYLEPGESKKWYLPVKISKSSHSRNNLVKFSFINQEEKEIHNSQLTFEVQESLRSTFQYQVSVLDNGEFGSKGNADGLLQVGESVALKVNVKNVGPGASGDLTILLKNGEGKRVFLKKGRAALDPLKKGENNVAYFSFDLKELPLDQDLDFSIDVLDGTYSSSSLNHKVKLPINEKNVNLTNVPPQISLKQEEHLSKKSEYLLSGNILDDKIVKDVYIFSNGKKIFYKNYGKEKNPTLVEFAVQVDLQDDSNQIVIISRDNENVVGRKNLYIRNGL